MRAKTAGHRANYLGVAALLHLLFGVLYSAQAAEANPLRPTDTSSPRATIQGFIETADDIYLRMREILEEYEKTDRLYLNASERQRQADILRNAPKVIRSLDVAGISPVLK